MKKKTAASTLKKLEEDLKKASDEFKGKQDALEKAKVSGTNYIIAEHS